MREQGGDSTLLLIAYRKATIALADEVLFLDGGRIADRGTHQELLERNPAYATARERLRDRGGGPVSTAVDSRSSTADGTSVDSGEEISARDTIRRGLAFSPELGDGFGWTLLLAAVGTAGRVVVPISMQQTLDRGINGPDGVDVSFVVTDGGGWRRSRSWRPGSRRTS